MIFLNIKSKYLFNYQDENIIKYDIYKNLKFIKKEK